MNLEYCKKLIEIKEQTFYDNNILKVIEKYIKDRGLVVYGGTAIHYLLKDSSKSSVTSGYGIYENKKFYDWDVYSFDIEKDVTKIIAILNKAGYFYINVINAIHASTKRIYVDFSREPIIDITGITPTSITYKNIAGFNIIDPVYIKRDMYFLLNFNFYRYTVKVEKYIKRLKLLEDNYPGFIINKSYKPYIKKTSSRSTEASGNSTKASGNSTEASGKIEHGSNEINPIESLGSISYDFPLKSANHEEIIKKNPNVILSGDYIYNYYFDPESMDLSKNEIVYILNSSQYQDVNITDVYKYNNKIFFFRDNEHFYQLLNNIKISHKLTLLYSYYHIGLTFGSEEYQTKILKLLADPKLFDISSDNIKLEYKTSFTLDK